MEKGEAIHSSALGSPFYFYTDICDSNQVNQLFAEAALGFMGR